jgi:hypothetical protein
MKRFIFPILSLALIASTSCQQEQTTKQYFEESPEIEVCKKAVKAFQEGDAETYRSCYADTVRIWHNQYWVKYPGKTIDEQMELLKRVHAMQENYRYEGEIWEMIIQDNGQNWVHFWAQTHTKLKGDDEKIEFVIHIAFSVVDNKIVYETLVYDNLPFYLAEQRMQKESN